MSTDSARYSLLVLGVAGGAGYVYQGQCSSSFLILRNDQPFCLVDLGSGVTRTLIQQGYAIPDNLIITHNHTDHAGELPVVVRVEQARGRELRVIAAAPVAERLKHFRMAEHNDLYPADSLANWLAVEPEQKVALSQELDITFLPTQHSEVCYGFILSRTTDGREILGYTGDSGRFGPLYSRVSRCLVAIFDARPEGNQWHAGIQELDAYRDPGHFIIGHGLVSPPSDETGEDDRLLQPGQRLELAMD